jgi:hypothetical protein
VGGKGYPIPDLNENCGPEGVVVGGGGVGERVGAICLLSVLLSKSWNRLSSM